MSYQYVCEAQGAIDDSDNDNKKDDRDDDDDDDGNEDGDNGDSDCLRLKENREIF